MLRENLFATQASTKRRLPPSLEDQPPVHYSSESKRAYTGPQGIYAKLSHPVLAQKTKAKPGTPPWRNAKEAHWKTQPRPPASERATPCLETTAQEETHHTPSPTHDSHEHTGILPPLADFDGKAINSDHPPFDTLSRWEEVPPPSRHGTRRTPSAIHAIWSQLWKGKLAPTTQLRIARNPFSVDWCNQWFNHLQVLQWERPKGQHGKPLNRKTAWFVQNGCNCTYDYGTMQISPRAFPEWLTDLMEIVMPECGFTDKAEWPNSCNINYYETHEDLVGPHADNEPLFQGKNREITIISLSLGGTRHLAIHSGRQVVGTIPLRNGDIMAMEKWIQSQLKHSIAKLSPSSREEPRRINLTWRWLVHHKPGCTADPQHTSPGPATLPVADAKDMAADEAERSWGGKSE